MLDELLREYAERFNEAFPMYSAPSNEDEIIKIIEKCFEINKPFKPKYEENVLYGHVDY